MNILIVEDDSWIAELLRQVVLSLCPEAVVSSFDTVQASLQHARSQRIDLLLTDLNLPDASGLEVIKLVRSTAPHSSRILLTASIDRATVLEARAAGISDFIAKPFSVDSLLQRLGKLLAPSGAVPSGETAGLDNLDEFLQQRLDQTLFLPWCHPDSLLAVEKLDADSQPRELLRLARLEPVLSAGLISKVNRQDRPENDFDCVSVEQAISELGMPACIELTQRLARTHPVLRDATLQHLAGELMQQQAELAKALTRLAHHQSVKPEPVRSAVSLCRLGEMSVLCAMQNFLNCGQPCDEAALTEAMRRFAPVFGNQIKIQLKLPFLLRELIGALFLLPQGSMRKDRVIMRIAALETGMDQDLQQLQQLRRWIGLPAD